jgi:hypothetical protein
MYQTSNCFQFAHSVRILQEILTDSAKITHLSLIPKLRRFELQNDTVLGFKTISFWSFYHYFLKKKRSMGFGLLGVAEPDLSHLLKREYRQTHRNAGLIPTARGLHRRACLSGLVRPSAHPGPAQRLGQLGLCLGPPIK